MTLLPIAVQWSASEFPASLDCDCADVRAANEGNCEGKGGVEASGGLNGQCERRGQETKSIIFLANGWPAMTHN